MRVRMRRIRVFPPSTNKSCEDSLDSRFEALKSRYYWLVIIIIIVFVIFIIIICKCPIAIAHCANCTNRILHKSTVLHQAPRPSSSPQPPPTSSSESFVPAQICQKNLNLKFEYCICRINHYVMFNVFNVIGVYISCVYFLSLKE